MVTKVYGTLLGWNRLDINGKAVNQVSPSIELSHTVKVHMESSCADAKTSHARMVCLDHVLEHLVCPAAAVKVGIKELKEQDQCRQVHAGTTIATARNDEAVKNAILGDSRPISSVTPNGFLEPGQGTRPKGEGDNDNPLGGNELQWQGMQGLECVETRLKEQSLNNNAPVRKPQEVKADATWHRSGSIGARH
jgi:hypothetical protein